MKLAGGKNNRGPSCAVCQERMPASWQGAVAHCDGPGVAWVMRQIEKPHHAEQINPVCWRCGGKLGCPRCASSGAALLCVRCAAWATPEGLAANGPILNSAVSVAKRHGVAAPQFVEYPEEFRRARGAGQDNVDFDPSKLSAPARRLYQLGLAGIGNGAA